MHYKYKIGTQYTLCNTQPTPCSQCKFRCNYTDRQTTTWKRRQQSQPDASHDLNVLSKIIRKLAYNTFVQPHLKYNIICFSSLVPMTKLLEDALEKVQH